MTRRYDTSGESRIVAIVWLSDGDAEALTGMHLIAGSDWVIDIGPGAGEEGGRVVCAGPPSQVAKSAKSRTAPYVARVLG